MFAMLLLVGGRWKTKEEDDDCGRVDCWQRKACTSSIRCCTPAHPPTPPHTHQHTKNKNTKNTQTQRHTTHPHANIAHTHTHILHAKQTHLVVQPPALLGDQVDGYTGAARRLAHQRNVVGVAAEVGDVLAHPPQGLAVVGKGKGDRKRKKENKEGRMKAKEKKRNTESK